MYKKEQKQTKITKMNKKEQLQTKTYKTGLTPLQEKVAILLANGESVSSIAEQLELNRGTIYQWQQKLAFQCYFNSQRHEAKETLQNKLYALYSKALKAVEDCLNSENEAVKLKTATYIIQRIEETPTDEVDIFEAIKKRSTKEVSLLPKLEETTTIFDNSEFNRLLKENDLK